MSRRRASTVTDEAPTLTLKAHQDAGGKTVLQVIGDIDLVSTDYLRTELLSAVEHGTVVLDLDGVAFCDSSGLRVLLEAARRAKTYGAAFRLAAPTAPVERLLDLTRADQVLEVFPDVDSALNR
jgi:anti-sigma B factor antagonist